MEGLSGNTVIVDTPSHAWTGPFDQVYTEVANLLMKGYDQTRNMLQYPYAKEGDNKKISLYNKDGFQANIDVIQFEPHEITVKTVDQTIMIEGLHEEKDDGYGIVSRHFLRKYKLPKDYDPESVYSTISTDGVLTVKATPEKPVSNGIEKTLEIQQVGPVFDQIMSVQLEDDMNNSLGNKFVEKARIENLRKFLFVIEKILVK